MPHQITDQDKDVAKAWMSELLPIYGAMMKQGFLDALRTHAKETGADKLVSETRMHLMVQQKQLGEVVAKNRSNGYPFPPLDVPITPKEDVLKKLLDHQRAYPQPDLSNAFGGIYKPAPDHKIEMNKPGPHTPFENEVPYARKLRFQKQFVAAVNRQEVWAQVYSAEYARLIPLTVPSDAGRRSIDAANYAIEQLENWLRAE